MKAVFLYPLYPSTAPNNILNSYILENVGTDYFGRITRDAVKKLQEKYGVSPVFGYFGSLTRRALGTLISNQ